jgi:stearoyl-CoA desaturase (Delta-9 desaturase)
LKSPTAAPLADRVDLVSLIPFIGWHLLLGLVFVVGVSWEYLAVFAVTYAIRMFAITAGYHRYFSHRAFKTGRVFQFILAFLAQTSAQKGVLWWAANHRHHHRHSDTEDDIHSPTRKGFWWSHVGWIVTKDYEATNTSAVKDFSKFPELAWLNRYSAIPALLMLPLLYALGGLPWVVWGGVVSTVALWHATFTINSLSHVFGARRYLTTDTSRNSLLLALLTFGEGWHNNHHYHQNTANQGWFWWEVDVTYGVLRVLSWLGVVHDLRLPSDQTRYAYRHYSEAQRAQLAGQGRFRTSTTPPEAAALPS